MLIRTHLAITVLGILLLISSVEYKPVFIAVALFATFIPDVDSGFSTLGRQKPSRILQMFVNHRGFIHSFSFLLLATLFFVLFIPLIALPFFLGYGLHIFADSFTIEGIKPFYPSKKTVAGKIRTGSFVETSLFVSLIVINLAVFGFLFHIF